MVDVGAALELEEIRVRVVDPFAGRTGERGGRGGAWTPTRWHGMIHGEER
jgi:hypothetical protein